MKNLFKYVLLILSCSLVLQGAWAGQGMGQYLNNVMPHPTKHTAVLDVEPEPQTRHVFQNTSYADACEEMLDHASQSDMVCEAGLACDMQFCAVSGFGLIPAFNVFAISHIDGSKKWAFDDAYHSQRYAPPVPPPLV